MAELDAELERDSRMVIRPRLLSQRGKENGRAEEVEGAYSIDWAMVRGNGIGASRRGMKGRLHLFLVEDVGELELEAVVEEATRDLPPTRTLWMLS